MNKRNLIIGGAVIIIAALVIGLVFLQRGGGEAALRRAISNNLEQASQTAAELQRADRITTVLVGTGSPLDQMGPQTATAVFVNGQFLLFDAGNNSLGFMNSLDIPMDELDAVFITHFHNDHYGDLGDVMSWSWILGRRKILPVHGPTGITQIVDGFRSAYELEESYRTAHHGEEIMPPEWAGTETFEYIAPEADEPMVVYENDGVTVEAFRATHSPIYPNVGYRITYGDTLIVISGDTILTSAVLANSQNADLLVSEIMNKAAVEVMENVVRETGNEDGAIIPSCKPSCKLTSKGALPSRYKEGHQKESASRSGNVTARVVFAWKNGRLPRSINKLLTNP